MGADVRQNLLYHRVTFADTKVRIVDLTDKSKTPQHIIQKFKHLIFNK